MSPAQDIRLACREGYAHVEHMKRYTTHSMATDQGRIGGLIGSAMLAAARGVPIAAVGQSTSAPLHPAGAVRRPGRSRSARALSSPSAGCRCTSGTRPHGARFVPTGLWLRPLVYSSASRAGRRCSMRRARCGARLASQMSQRSARSTCREPMQAAFLDFVYANTFSTLAGRPRALRHDAARGRHGVR